MKLLKIGGSVITDKKGYKKARPKAILAIAKTVADIWRRGARDLILVHGAGSFGHAVVIQRKLEDGVKNTEQKVGFADTHASCSELSLLLVKALVDNGVPAISIPPAVVLKLKEKRISSFDLKIVHDYLASGYLPVLYGDMVPDSIFGGYPCSGDQIIAYLGREADFVVLATNVDGVFDENGKVIPEITKANLPEISKHLSPTKNDVTGGMIGKISELLELSTPAYIVNAHHPERIEALFLGKNTICTKITK